MPKRILLYLVAALVLLATAKLWLWEQASTPHKTSAHFGDLPIDVDARHKRY